MSRKRIIGIVVILIVACCLGAFALDRAALQQTYERHPVPAGSLLPTYDLYQKDYPRTDVEFQLGEYTLRGHVYGPDNKRGLIVFRHGMFSQHQDYLPMITAMVDKGWRVFAYDAIGCGASDGDSALGMSQSPRDVAAAIDFARQNGLANGMPLVLWGHSWGGYGVAAALRTHPDVDACVTMSGFDTPLKVLSYSATSAYGILGRIQEPFLWLNTVIDFGDEANVSASDAVVDSGVPTLVIQGRKDTTVPYDDVSILGALRDRIQDLPTGKISLITMEDEGRDGHNNYFYSPASQAYLNECSTALQKMLDENDDDATAPEVLEYLNSVDLMKANTADPELIGRIDAFLADSVAR